MTRFRFRNLKGLVSVLSRPFCFDSRLIVCSAGLHIPQSSIVAFSFDELIMGSRLYDATLAEDMDGMSISDG